MELNEVLLELVNFVKNTAPEVWSIYLKQVYVNAIIETVIAVLALIGIIYCAKGLRTFSYHLKTLDIPVGIDDWYEARRFVGKYEELSEERKIVAAGYACLTIISSLIFLLCSISAFKQFVNPEFYVIQNFLRLLGQ